MRQKIGLGESSGIKKSGYVLILCAMTLTFASLVYAQTSDASTSVTLATHSLPPATPLGIPIIVSVRNCLEILYFIAAGPLLVAIAFYGLRQIRIAMKQVKTTEEVAKKQNLRHALKITLEQCEFFKEHILKPFGEMTNIVNNPAGGKKAKTSFTAHTKISIVADRAQDGIQIQCNTIKGVKQNELEKEYKDFAVQLFEIANNCELFAMYFRSGVGHESMAFRPCGPEFCRIVDALFPLISPKHANEKLFVNTMSLYLTWKMQLKEEKMRDQISELQVKIGNSNFDNKSHVIL